MINNKFDLTFVSNNEKIHMLDYSVMQLQNNNVDCKILFEVFYSKAGESYNKFCTSSTAKIQNSLKS